MRKLLILAFLLYDVIALAMRSNHYDYDNIDGTKRHSILDDRRNWRKKALLIPVESRKDWQRSRHEYDNPKYLDEHELKGFNGMDRPRDQEFSSAYRQRHYDDIEKPNVPQAMKSSELAHAAAYFDKETEKKSSSMPMNCEKQHERYEACFAGCASVTCDNPRDRLRPCYPFCESGCICVHPYVRDDRTHKCVLPEDCTKGLKGIPDLGEDIM